MKTKRKIYIYLGVILFTTLFPYIVTIICMQNTNTRIYEPKDSGRTIRLTKEVSMDLEKFLPCVLYASLPYDYPREALKTQLVILRTYILRKMGDEKELEVSKLELPYISYSDLEREWGSEYERNYNEAMGLVQETNLQVLYYEGDLIYPYYHEISEGTTCVGEFAYLQPAVSSEDSTADNYLSIFYFTTDEVAEICKNQWGVNVAGTDLLSQIAIEKYENCNYVSRVKIGEQEISPENFMQAFALASTSFAVEEFAQGIKMVCKGVGSGKGVSIYGACCMAEQGSDYRDILCHYYTGIEIGQMR